MGWWRALAASLGAAAVAAGCRSTLPESAGDHADELPPPLTRSYRAGETVRYVMSGSHRSPAGERRYTAESEGRVERGADGAFFETTRWVRLEVDGQAVALDGPSADFRQQLSLDADYEMPFPDIRGVNPMLIGPIFDLMTFYVDLHPSLQQGRLAAAGDRVHVPHGEPNRWADGTRVLVGEDCIDFELSLVQVTEDGAQLRVMHVPPAKSSVALASDWMRVPVGAAPNNWVQVVREGGGAAPAFVAAVGHETFDVDIRVDRATGRIVSAVMENPVDVVQRRCRDEALRDCDDPTAYRIFRRIELRPAP